MSNISRQAAIDAADRADCTELAIEDVKKVTDEVVKELKQLPSAQPEQRWIPVKTRPMDEEEKQSIKPYLEEHYGYTLDECDCILFDCPMPDDGQEVWVCSKCGNVWQDSCVIDEGIGLEENGDWDDIVAWMPFERPKPWRGEEDG